MRDPNSVGYCLEAGPLFAGPTRPNAFLLVPRLALVFVIMSSQATAQPRLEPTGTYRALVVFVRFEDDSLHWETCTPASEQWSDPDRLPDFAANLLASSPEPPFPEESLTAYLGHQSAGQFILFGDVYPHVLVAPASSGHDRGTVERVANYALHLIDDSDDIDLSAYDYNEDGYIDQVFFIFRSVPKGVFPGDAAGISYIGYQSPEPEFGRDRQNLKRVSNGRSGSCIVYRKAGNIYPEINLVRTLAHEIVHDLLNELAIWSHLAPFASHEVTASGDQAHLGYALMVGDGDTRGDETISAFERQLIDPNWISCVPLERDSSVVVEDLYSGRENNCYSVPVPRGSSSGPTLFLSNRQRVGFFDRLRANTCTATPNYHGLKETGLLAMLARSPHKPIVSVLPADGDLALDIGLSAYEGDLFKPETRVQLTPWTSPSINGHLLYSSEGPAPDGFFQAIDNIRYSGGADGEIAFDFIADFRTRPVIREDSRIGAETDGYRFDSLMRITDGATLTIASDIAIDRLLVVESGATLVIAPGGTLRIGPAGRLVLNEASRLVVEGVLEERGSSTLHPRAIIEGVTSAAGTATLSRACGLGDPYPNPVHHQLSVPFTSAENQDVRIDLVDMLGRTVAVVLDEPVSSGNYAITWRPPASTPAGTLMVRFTCGAFVETRSVVLVR